MALSAYAPADGSDGLDYILHAAYLAGKDVPATFEAHPPVYPLAIWLFYYQFGQIYLLLVLQVLMGIATPILYYLAIKSYNPLMGFIVGLVIAFDMQVLVIFNFIHTEPFYIFFLALSFYLLIRQINRQKKTLIGDIFLVISLILLAYTRSVGQYLIVPVAVIYLLKTRNLLRVAALILIYLVGVQLFLMSYKMVFQIERSRANTESNSLLMQPLSRSGLLSAENGEASRRLVAIMENCPDAPPYSPCVFVAEGGMQEGQALIRAAYIELLLAKPFDYALHVIENMEDFLRLHGMQYTESASQVQCIDVTARLNRWLERNRIEDSLLVTGEVNDEVLTAEVRASNAKLCPMYTDSEFMRGIVNAMAQRYKSLSRPQPWLYYGGLLLLLTLPIARKYWSLLVSALFFLLYHAGISALIYNIQSRYVVVTNGFRALLLVALLYILATVVIDLINRYLLRNEPQHTSETNPD